MVYLHKIVATLVFSCALIGLKAQYNTVGLISKTDGVSEGYVLFTPMAQKKTFLINNEGELLHEWISISNPGHTVYLNEDGTLYRTGQLGTANSSFVEGLGGGGKIERYDWDSKLIWEFTYDDENVKQHHDFQVLPNGNVLILAWEVKNETEVLQAGKNPAHFGTNALWPDHIVEVEPQGTNGGIIVWEWHVWDHLIQDFDNTKDNFGVVEDNPQLVDINYFKEGEEANPDWNHTNAIDYDAENDQIILSVWAFDEFWIIDHSTTTAEAKGHIDGTSGKGGDLLYRWGNPATYKKGTIEDKKLFQQHNVHRIPTGKPNAGDILLFNNGTNRQGTLYSSVPIIATPRDGNGHYLLNANGVFEPADYSYNYTAPIKEEFFSSKFSSAQQLSNGNILVCSGPQGTFFEIDPAEEIVWKYINPVLASGVLTQGETPIANPTFRTQKLPTNYPAFDGKTLSPQGVLELQQVVSGVQIPTKKNIRLYPNPASSIVTFSGITIEPIRIEIYSATGRLVTQFNLTGSDFSFSTSNLETGLYFVKIADYGIKKLLVAR